MECTKCHKILDKDKFSYKNVEEKIYYLHCDSCREKMKNQLNKKKVEKEKYEFIKRTNEIHCECGRKYIAFREYHIKRHVNSIIHLSYLMSIREYQRVSESNI